jgi:hypothetical protein
MDRTSPAPFIRPIRLAYQPHQSAVLFARNKPGTSNQPAVLAFLSEQIGMSHQPNEQADYYYHSLLIGVAQDQLLN